MSDDADTHMLVLRSDRHYLLAFLDAHKEQSHQSISDLFFGDALATAQDHGVRETAFFHITEAEHCDISVDRIGLFEWPSSTAASSFFEIPDWHAALVARDRGFSDVHELHFTVAEDAEIELAPGGVYEFAAFWMNRKNGALMGQYFKKMGPLVSKAQVRPLANIKPVKLRSPYALMPDRFNFLHWSAGHEARKQIFASEEFKENGYLRALALDRMMTVMIAPDAL